jgi:hypothetical protein
MMCSRSTESRSPPSDRVVSGSGSGLVEGSAMRMSRSERIGASANIQARSRQLRSSRTFPRHGAEISRRSACALTPPMDFLNFAANSLTKLAVR